MPFMSNHNIRTFGNLIYVWERSMLEAHEDIAATQIFYVDGYCLSGGSFLNLSNLLLNKKK